MLPGPGVWKPADVNTLASQTLGTPVLQRYYGTGVFIGTPCTITNLHLGVGNPGGTDSTIGLLVDPLGRPLATTDKTSGTVVSSTIDTFQTIALEAPYKIWVPGVYTVWWTFNGTTTRFRCYGSVGTRCPTAAYDSGLAWPNLPTSFPVPTSYTSGQGPCTHTS